MDKQDSKNVEEHEDDDFAINPDLGNVQDSEGSENDEDFNEGEQSVDSNDEDDLEKIVLGGEDDIEGDFDEFIVTRKRKGDDNENVQKKPKWHDEDDKIEISNDDLKPAWAQKKPEVDNDDDDDNSDDEDKIDWRTGDYITKSKFISHNHLSFMRCIDINKECPAKGKVRVLEFLPKAAVAIVAGADQSLSLFQVDGKTNLKVQTILFENFPVFRAHFSADGNEILVGSVHPSLLSYNMNTGRTTKFQLKENELIKNTKLFAVSPDGQYIAVVGSFGHVHILGAKSKKCYHLLKADCNSVEALAFSHDGNELYTHGADGIVNRWFVKSFSCTLSFQDEGCILGTAIAVSPDGKFLATGSSTGIVNIYDKNALHLARNTEGKYQIPQPKPLKTVENLVSPCTSLVFNHTSELLAMASNYADNALKMLHLRSMTVYANFPSVTKNIGVPYSIGFSPNSGYFAVGTHKGRAQLLRLQHYSTY